MESPAGTVTKLEEPTVEVVFVSAPQLEDAAKFVVLCSVKVPAGHITTNWLPVDAILSGGAGSQGIMKNAASNGARTGSPGDQAPLVKV